MPRKRKKHSHTCDFNKTGIGLFCSSAVKKVRLDGSPRRLCDYHIWKMQSAGYQIIPL